MAADMPRTTGDGLAGSFGWPWSNCGRSSMVGWMDHGRDAQALRESPSNPDMSLSQAKTPDGPRHLWSNGWPQPCADTWAVVALLASEQRHATTAQDPAPPARRSEESVIRAILGQILPSQCGSGCQRDPENEGPRSRSPAPPPLRPCPPVVLRSPLTHSAHALMSSHP
ncbi:hypothetical protein FDECE_14027 [Fusarium decemcellulare]|nr:hypothetical protein FDECE_14027 [Fusarium decemcellulare]